MDDGPAPLLLSDGGLSASSQLLGKEMAWTLSRKSAVDNSAPISLDPIGTAVPGTATFTALSGTFSAPGTAPDTAGTAGTAAGTAASATISATLALATPVLSATAATAGTFIHTAHREAASSSQPAAIEQK